MTEDTLAVDNDRDTGHEPPAATKTGKGLSASDDPETAARTDERLPLFLNNCALTAVPSDKKTSGLVLASDGPDYWGPGQVSGNRRATV